MKKLMVILMVFVMMFGGCASSKMFKYADEKADKLLVENTTLREQNAVIVTEYNKAMKFINDTKSGISKANFPVPYLRYLNSLAQWNFPIEIAVLDTAKKESVK